MAKIVENRGMPVRFILPRPVQPRASWLFACVTVVALFSTQALAREPSQEQATATTTETEDETENSEKGAGETIDESSINNLWHKAKHRGVSFRAIGQEPGWLLEITTGTEIFLSSNYGQSETAYAYTEPQVDVDRQQTRYVTGDGDVEILIEGKECRDVMSGERFSMTVTITLRGKQLPGCGRALH